MRTPEIKTGLSHYPDTKEPIVMLYVFLKHFTLRIEVITTNIKVWFDRSGIEPRPSAQQAHALPILFWPVGVQ